MKTHLSSVTTALLRALSLPVLWALAYWAQLSIGEHLDVDVDRARLFRRSLFIAGAYLVLREWYWLNTWLNQCEANFRKYLVKNPARWDKIPQGPIKLLLLTGAWLLLGTQFTLWGRDVVDQLALLDIVLWAALMAWITMMSAALVLGTPTSLWFHQAARRVHPPTLRLRKRPLPLVTVLVAMPAVTLALMLPPTPPLAQGIRLALASHIDNVDTTITPRSQILVELGDDDNVSEIEPVLRRYGATAERAFPEVSVREDHDLAATWLVHVDQHRSLDLVEALDLDKENVDDAGLDVRALAEPALAAGRCEQGPAGVYSTPNDPLALRQRWLRRVGVPAALSLVQRWRIQKPAIVAIIDTGIDAHEDLSDVLMHYGERPQNEHGTNVASAVGAITNNGIGIATLNERGRLITLRSYPALTHNGGGAYSVTRAILDATEDGSDVINLSLGTEGDAPAAVVRAVAYALRRGVIVVAAAGNDGPYTQASDQWPSGIPGVIAVAALGDDNKLAPLSSHVDDVDRGIAAPGTDVCVATLRNGYAERSGTSIASGIVAGVIGAMRARCPQMDARDAYTVLVQTGGYVDDNRNQTPTLQADDALRAISLRCP